MLNVWLNYKPNDDGTVENATVHWELSMHLVRHTRSSHRPDLEASTVQTSVREADNDIRDVLEVVGEAVSKGETEDARAQPPQEFDSLFSGSAGQMNP